MVLQAHRLRWYQGLGKGRPSGWLEMSGPHPLVRLHLVLIISQHVDFLLATCDVEANFMSVKVRGHWDVFLML